MMKNYKNYFLLILIILTGLFPVLYYIQAEEAVTVTAKVVYSEEIHEFSTTESFSESLLNPNGTYCDIDFPVDFLLSGETVEITMYSISESAVVSDFSLPSEKLASDTFYNFSFKRVSDNSTISSFDKPVTLTFYYIDSDISGIDESTLVAYRWNGSEWVALSDSVVDTSLNKVTASTQQFSYFSILGDPLPSCGNGTIETGESCDGSDLGGESCVSQGYVSGTLTCNANCTFNTSGCSAGGGGGGGGGGGYIAPTETKVIIKGTAYPEAEITLLSDGKVEATKKADSLANFSFDITNITSGIYTFSLWALDKKGARSITFSFTTNVAKNMTTTVSGIFLPPTIELSKTKLQRGEILSIYGQTAPESKIEISVESPELIEKITIADEEGDWEYPFSTKVLDDGLHTARAKATSSEGLLSSYSKVLNFYIGEGVPGIILNGDLNDDTKVNLVDFSILLYYWGTTDVRADQNGDGKVNLTDFSILLYYWTG